MIIAPSKKRIGVLRGGPSPEYEVSLNTGKFVLQNLKDLPGDQYEPVDIFVSKSGVWHEYGYEKTPEKIVKKLDGVWNAMHGTYGEDGTLQRTLEALGTPYTGSGVLASSAGMNKILTKRLFGKFCIKTPSYIVVNKEEQFHTAVDKIFNEIPFPIVLKPANSGSSLGVFVCFNRSQLVEALHKVFAYSPNVIAEEFIQGKEATCGVVQDYRNQNVYGLLPVEVILPKNRTFYDYRAKYEDRGKEYLSPGNFSTEEMQNLKDLAVLIHTSLGLRHYSRSDFIVHPKRGVYALEVNTLPALSEKSSFVKSLEAVGSNIKEFLQHTLDKALGKDHKRNILYK